MTGFESDRSKRSIADNHFKSQRHQYDDSDEKKKILTMTLAWHEKVCLRVFVRLSIIYSCAISTKSTCL